MDNRSLILVYYTSLTGRTMMWVVRSTSDAAFASLSLMSTHPVVVLSIYTSNLQSLLGTATMRGGA